MLLRDVQLSLKALIVFDYAFPETSRFETIMKEEFNEHAEVYVETGSKYIYSAWSAMLTRCSARDSPRAYSWDASACECSQTQSWTVKWFESQHNQAYWYGRIYGITVVQCVFYYETYFSRDSGGMKLLVCPFILRSNIYSY